MSAHDGFLCEQIAQEILRHLFTLEVDTINVLNIQNIFKAMYLNLIDYINFPFLTGLIVKISLNIWAYLKKHKHSMSKDFMSESENESER